MTFKQGQDHHTYHDNVDPEQGYNPCKVWNLLWAKWVASLKKRGMPLTKSVPSPASGPCPLSGGLVRQCLWEQTDFHVIVWQYLASDRNLARAFLIRHRAPDSQWHRVSYIDLPLHGIAVPKLTADFGLTGQDYSEHNLHCVTFVCVISYFDSRVIRPSSFTR